MATKRPRRKLARDRDRVLCSIETLKGSEVTVADIVARDKPENPVDAFRTARQWAQFNFFIGGMLHLKAAFVNYRLRLLCADKSSDGPFQTWLKSEQGRTRMDVEKYIQSCVDEWLLQDNLVSFWRDDADFPYPLPCERCRYTDTMGVEVLRVKLGAKPEDIREGGFTAEEVRRYTQGEIILDERKGEHFLVLNRNPRGRGFNYPRMAQIFWSAGQNESMEVGESLLAYCGRTVIRMHHLGWEVRQNSGVRQNDPIALWDKPRAAAIEKFFQGLQGGVAETSANFDHKISFVWPDPKLYGADKWKTIVERMKWYVGALAFMLLSNSPNPNLILLFRTEIEKIRQDLKPHLERVINASMKPPGGIQLSWGNRCFTDPRLFWDILKALMIQGPLPLQTALKDAADMDPNEAASLKVAEAEDPQSKKKYWPLYDPAHGNRPGEPGRTPGTKDGEGKA